MRYASGRRAGVAFGSPPGAVKSPALLEARSHIVTAPLASCSDLPNFLWPRKWDAFACTAILL
jgi:hypothetical protein